MLTAADALRSAGRRRPPPSLTQLYHEYVMQRIEAFKNSVTRDEIMRLAGEATAGLYDSDESQLVLTELLTGEVVDALIRKKLKLKTQKKFGEHVLKLRAAQKEPTHWGLDESLPGRAAAEAAGPDRPGTRRRARVPRRAPASSPAHDVDVVFWASDLGVVERLEQRLATESLAARFFALMVHLRRLASPCTDPFDLVVVDLASLAEAGQPDAVRRAPGAAVTDQ